MSRWGVVVYKGKNHWMTVANAGVAAGLPEENLVRFVASNTIVVLPDGEVYEGPRKPIGGQATQGVVGTPLSSPAPVEETPAVVEGKDTLSVELP